MIAEEDIERVRNTANTVEIIRKYVPLFLAGGDWRGRCPFCKRHKRFRVSNQKQLFLCLDCNTGGDVFHFLQKHLGMQWEAAVRAVAYEAGVPIVERGPPTDEERQQMTDRVNAENQKTLEILDQEDRAAGVLADLLTGKGGVFILDIAHDDDCGYFTATKACTCNPDTTIRTGHDNN